MPSPPVKLTSRQGDPVWASHFRLNGFVEDILRLTTNRRSLPDPPTLAPLLLSAGSLALEVEEGSVGMQPDVRLQRLVKKAAPEIIRDPRIRRVSGESVAGVDPDAVGKTTK